ncbi:Conserved hypothetical protein [Leptospira biflexa serovar Patoc strain 'Patoc 1 (Ames)']|nr:Conserved hypothetical protein [Leptospira biflexa serovar Patoc strain 'Patoc 1 (Ames)']
MRKLNLNSKNFIRKKIPNIINLSILSQRKFGKKKNRLKNCMMISSSYKINFPIFWTKNSKSNPRHQTLLVNLQFISKIKSISKEKFFLIHSVQKPHLDRFHSRLVRKVCLFILPFVFLQCASSGFGTQGLLYENQRISLMETGNSATKEGFSCAKSYLGLIALGDASIETAQKQGNIKEITSIELETYNFLGIYAKLCTVTKGI